MPAWKRKEPRRGNATCPGCGGRMRADATVCQGCHHLRCRICRQFARDTISHWCWECLRALEATEYLNDGRRPEGFAWPAGHLERLAERAARREPLFA